MNVLVACEESQRVCIAFRNKGHNAFSCDLLECSGGFPEWHIKGDVLPILNGDCEFKTQDNMLISIIGKWDLIIAHPPCTYLAISGNRWFSVDKYSDKAYSRYSKRIEAFNFFMLIAQANCDKIAIENPVGYVNTHYRKPNQIIQPYMFGDNARKKTCLWLKNLPLLKPTDIVSPGVIYGKGFSVGASSNYARDENNKIISWNDPRTAVIRSKTFPGIAIAMADQWG